MTTTDLLSVAVEEDGPTPVVLVTGELDIATADLLRSCIARLVSAGASQVVVDCAGLEFADSTGLGVLAAAQARLGIDGGCVVVRRPSAKLTRVLDLSGLSRILRVEP